jgi:hypothetical protein
MASSSNEGSTASENDFNTVYQSKQVEKVVQSGTSVDRKLLKGVISVPKHKVPQAPVITPKPKVKK